MVKIVFKRQVRNLNEYNYRSLTGFDSKRGRTYKIKINNKLIVAHINTLY